jgi:hypothetical protein
MSNIDQELDKREADHAIKNYTRIPNMLVDGYTNLHPQDKWLFVCLVHLCGKEHTRYLALRYISKRTGFSASVLSDNKKTGKPGMIRRLHSAGLIHAEIKRRKNREGEEFGNEVYHITITDTWALNYDFYNGAKTRSEIEQDLEEPVLNSNKPVLNQDKKSTSCSEIEQACSDSGTNIRLHSKTTNNNKITDNKRENATTQKPTTSTPNEKLSPSSSFLNKSLSPEVIAFMDMWDDICGYKVARDEKHIKAAIQLVQCDATREEVIAVREYCRKKNPEWYESGVDLAAISRYWGKWKDHIQQEANKSKPATSSTGMSKDEATMLAIDVLETTKKVGYSNIKADPIEQNGVWKVNIVWEDGNAFFVRSREQWGKQFIENLEMDGKQLPPKLTSRTQLDRAKAAKYWSKKDQPQDEPFYAATILHENAQRDIRRLDPDYIEDPEEADLLTPGELAAYDRALGV